MRASALKAAERIARTSYAEDLFAFQVKAYRLRAPVREHRFARELGREWRFDFAWPDLRIAAEIDGGIWTGGAHGRPAAIERDMAKANDAMDLHWRVYRFTPVQVKNGDAIRRIRAQVPRDDTGRSDPLEVTA